MSDENYYLSKKTMPVPEKAARKIFKDAQKSDEVWEYWDIQFLSGTAGYILVRDGNVVNRNVTMLS